MASVDNRRPSADVKTRHIATTVAHVAYTWSRIQQTRSTRNANDIWVTGRVGGPRCLGFSPSTFTFASGQERPSCSGWGMARETVTRNANPKAAGIAGTETGL